MTGVLKPLSGAEPRSAHGLVIDTFHLYRRYPLLFLVLAAAVIVPYELIVLAVTKVGPFEQGTLDAVVGLWLTLADLALVAPLVSVQPYMGLDYVLRAFFVLVVGGLGSPLGMLSGAATIGGVESAVSALADRTAGYSTVLLIAIFFLWWRPRGLFGRS